MRKSAAPLLMSAIVLLCWSASAESQTQKKKATQAKQQSACYETRVSEAEGPVRRVLFDNKTKSLMVDKWGLPNLPYIAGGLRCERRNSGAYHCSIDCDGGEVMLTPVGNRLRVAASGLRLMLEIETALPFQFEADGVEFTGRYDLNPVSPEVCTGEFDREGRSAGDLRAGDFTPRVLKIERSLANLGLFAHQPDWYFTSETEEALKSFQRSAGMDVTGVANAATIARLQLEATLRGGC